MEPKIQQKENGGNIPPFYHIFFGLG